MNRHAPAMLIGSRFQGGQRGVVLVVALVALVAMTLAGLALIRSIDVGLSISGNMAFKATTTAAADIATDVATSWLRTNSAPASVLQNNQTVYGYYATWMSGCDMTGNRTPTDTTDNVGWTTAAGTSCNMTAYQVPNASMPSGYSATFVVTRMCTCAGAPGANVCTVNGVPNMANVCAGSTMFGPFNGIPTYDYRGMTGREQSGVSGASPYYRVVARVEGPRNTVSYVETVVTLE